MSLLKNLPSDKLAKIADTLEIVSILPNPWPIYLPLVLRTLRLLMHAFRSFHILRHSVAQIVTTSLRLNIIINGLNLLKMV